RTATFQLSDGSQVYTAMDAGLTPSSGQARQAVTSEPVVLPTIYPNPSEGRMILTDIKGYEQITIFDLSGKRVERLSVDPQAGQLKIDLAHLPKGVYTLALEGQNMEQFTQRIILK
ncbi:MAG: T9SS type A sorting domain-containing protein, partial [Bacteroidota bacterium]